MHNLKPKKYLGQHFLKDAEIAQRIVLAITADANSQIVEIGPGEGVLTAILLEKYPALMAVEVDPDAVAHLQKRFKTSNLNLIHKDVLKWQPAEHLSGPTHFIGNLPYNISSPFFFNLIEYRDYVSEGVFMIQKEVAERICANEGSKTYGILSVLLGTYFEREYLFSVPPNAFRPPPKVMSGVLRLKKKHEAPDVSFSDLKRVVKAAFNQRRKTLRNALKGFDFSHLPAGKWEAIKGLRAEQLPIEEFWALVQK